MDDKRLVGMSVRPVHLFSEMLAQGKEKTFDVCHFLQEI